MTIALVEGQSFAANYTLLHPLSEQDLSACWLAMDEEISERVCLRILPTLHDASKQVIRSQIAAQQGLHHESIIRLRSLQHSDGVDFVTSHYVQGARPLTFDNNFAQVWPLLRKALTAIEFAHGLGFVHGHLHPGNVLVDAKGEVSVTDFGLAGHNSEALVYSSPAVQGGQSPKQSDDIFSIGQLLAYYLTGRTLPAGQQFSSDQPLPANLTDLVSSMVDVDPTARPGSVATVINVLDDFSSGTNPASQIDAAAFSRVKSSGTPSVATPGVSAHRLPRERQVVSMPVALGLFGILMLLVLGVFFLLPDGEPGTINSTGTPNSPTVETSPGHSSAASSEPEVVIPPLEAARLKQLELDAEQRAADLLRLQIEVEDSGGQIWSKEAYLESTRLGLAGDEAFREGNHQLALDQYESSIAVLEQILASKDGVFVTNLERGKTALAEGDAETALAAFTVCYAINPADTVVRKGLARAENLEQVLNQVSDATVLEKNGDLKAALARFREAQKLDPVWPAASSGVNRIQQKMATVKFNDQMSEGFRHLAAGDFDAAIEAFEAARKILPDATAPDDGIAQVNIARRQESVNALKQKAADAVTNEAWAEAIGLYDEILLLANGDVDATAGREDALARQSLEKSLLTYLDQPGLLVDDEPLAEARRVLREAARIRNPGPVLKEQVNRLAYLISVARIEVPVQLKSDGKTDVTVYRVGYLGTFQQQALSLYPGNYTFVGKRKGFRDVHQQVAIEGGKTAAPVTIVCTERI